MAEYNRISSRLLSRGRVQPSVSWWRSESVNRKWSHSSSFKPISVYLSTVCSFLSTQAMKCNAVVIEQVIRFALNPTVTNIAWHPGWQITKNAFQYDDIDGFAWVCPVCDVPAECCTISDFLSLVFVKPGLVQHSSCNEILPNQLQLNCRQEKCKHFIKKVNYFPVTSVCHCELSGLVTPVILYSLLSLWRVLIAICCQIYVGNIAKIVPSGQTVATVVRTGIGLRTFLLCELHFLWMGQVAVGKWKRIKNEG